MDFKMNSRGQVTIFIILALIIVVLILLLFFLRKGPDIKVVDENNPQAYIESCTRGIVEEALAILMPQGGDIKPRGSVKYEGIDRTYLCYNNVFFKKCINQRPLLIEHIENEITNYSYPLIQNCFKELEFNLKKRYDIESGDLKVTTSLRPKQISVNIDKKIKLTNGENVREFNNFKMNMIHPIFNFAEIAMEIANQETQYCNFDVLGYMILYPKYDIQSTIMYDDSGIYTITERSSNQKFTFAIKSCRMPAGF